MAAEITQLFLEEFNSPLYSAQDSDLIPSYEVNTSLNSDSYIEFFIYDLSQNLLSENYNFTDYTVTNDGQSAGSNGALSKIELNPSQSVLVEGYSQGEFIAYYNFFEKKIGSPNSFLFISEISSDRTELRLDSTSIIPDDIIDLTQDFIAERNESLYFLDFYLNFGSNNLSIANNIILDNLDPSNPTILVKLYEPLPEEFDINSVLWIVTSLEEPIAYKVSWEDIPVTFIDTVGIQGPNFNIDLKDQVNNSTLELSYTDLITTSLTSSFNQLNSLLEEKEIEINVDYENFSNFVHFSSVQTRIENFFYKLKLIESYSSSLELLGTTTNTSLSSSQAIYSSKIDNIITNFDGYEYFLYYSDSPYAWPKVNSEKPYELYGTDTPTALTWLGSTNYSSPYYGGILLSASLYDEGNKDNLLYTIPEYLRDDSANEPYELFVEMVAQHYDNIWIYYKDVSNKYNADNRLTAGISNDIVADAIRDFGVKLYQNNFSNQDLYTAFLGLTPNGALFPFPEITGSLPTPTGFEYVDTLISASNDYMPLDDVNKSLYKRIYHNLPYLLKSKGTLPGLRALITSYGIPDTILRINEYGGKDKVDSNDWDYWQNEFNYALRREGNNYMSSEWSLNPDWSSPDDVPSTLAFRFKTDGLPQTNIPYSQSLWYIDSQTALTLTYTGSGYTSGSYSGSIIDPYYQYATLTLYPDAVNYPNSTASIYLPFFDGGWWSTMVTRNGDDFVLYVGNKIYEGGDNGTLLGFYASSSITEDSTSWTASGQFSAFGRLNNSIPGGTYNLFSGSYQEVRYYTTVLNENVFKDYIMNPYSIEGNSLNSGPNELAFRASLGGELYTGSVSIHPKVTGSWATTSSFVGNSDFGYNLTPTFIPNTEYFFYDQPVAGIKNTVGDKIRLENNSLPFGNTLSPFRPLSQTTEASASYTPNINYLEVAFSPQNEINEDIMDQLGFFNIGDYIGDPAFRSSRLTSYPDLDKLRNEYFEKYTKNYDLVDFIRLIKFFDNSLFKMIKDFVPARTSLSSGVVIKQHLLERNRYPQPQVTSKSNITQYAPLICTNISSSTIYFTSSNFQFTEVSSGSSTLLPYSSYSGTLPSGFNLLTGTYIVSGLATFNVTASLTTSGSVGSTGWALTKNGITLIPAFYQTNLPGSNITEYYSASFTATTGDIIQIEGFRSDNSSSVVTSGYIEFTESSSYCESNDAPYIVEDISLLGTVTPQWNDYNPGTIENFSGGTGGSFESYNYVENISQSWYENLNTPLGEVTILHNSQEEFYDGEFSGSVILVTTQSLHQPYAIENVSFEYTPIAYSNTLYNQSQFSTFTEGQFFSELTFPQQGGILILIPRNSRSFSPPPNGYIKIHKIDANGVDGTLPLGQLSNLLIKYTLNSTYTNYIIQTISEYPDYYLYEYARTSYVSSTTGIDTEVKNYFVSASTTQSITPPFNFTTLTNFSTVTGNINSYFNPSTGRYTTPSPTPNVLLSITASALFNGASGGSAIFTLRKTDTAGNITDLAQIVKVISPSFPSASISASFYGFPGDDFRLGVQKSVGSPQLLTGSILVTQSIFPTASVQDTIIIEPYITVPNFYNSDQNAFINNAFELRPNTLNYQDADYNSGTVIPTNFNLLISGSALRATVQDSNYTTKRHILPRYEGSRTTSQNLNRWSPLDVGTYGKSPVIELDKVYVVYSDTIGGYTPERMDTSAVSIKYLIDRNGDVVIPNTTPNSLEITQGTFITGDQISITTDGIGSGKNSLRKIVRGGQRIEPILYTQVGHSPASWINNTTITMSFTTDFVSDQTNVGDYQATSNPSNAIACAYQDGVFAGLNFNNNVYIGPEASPWVANGYTVTQSLIDENVTLTAKVRIKAFIEAGTLGAQTHYIITRLIRNRGGVETVLATDIKTGNLGSYPERVELPIINISVDIPPQSLQDGDVILVKGKHETTTYGTPVPSIIFSAGASSFKISQNPTPTGVSVTSSGTNTIWGYPDNTKLYAITASASPLNDFFNNGFRQIDIPGSGFNPITLPYSIEIGDEFRFEGNESNTFMVKRIYDTDAYDNDRISPTGSVEVHFNGNLPSSSINLDHFLIRRYVDDASCIIFEGLKPNPSGAGPYLVRPQYLIPELNQNIDTFVTNLVQKGLL